MSEGEVHGAPETPRRKPWLATAVAIVSGVGCLATLLCALGVGGMFVFLNAGKEELRPGDRAAVITVDDVRPYWPDLAVERGAEDGFVTRYEHGGWHVACNYTPMQATSSPLVIRSFLSNTPSEQFAEETFETGLIALDLSVAAFGSGVTRSARDDLFSWGDQSQFELLLDDGTPYGNILLVRRGGRVLMVLLVGLYFDDAESAGEFFEPLLERAWAFDLE